MNYWIHVANVLYLASYLVKDILWLRVLTVVAGVLLIPYYFMQPMPLWPAIAWSGVFLAVNVVQIKILLLERRPVRLAPDELRLYELVLHNLSPRQFARLLRAGHWEDVAVGERVIERGKPLERLIVVFSGSLAVEVEGRQKAALKVGHFAGEMSFVTGEVPSADVFAREKARIFVWKSPELVRTLEGQNELSSWRFIRPSAPTWSESYGGPPWKPWRPEMRKNCARHHEAFRM
jgi:Popeye protein conserved region